MRAIILILLLFMSSKSFAFQRCAVEDVNPAQKFFVDIQTQLLSTSRKLMTTNISQPKIIPVVFHVIEKEVDATALDAQIDVLNSSYALTGFKFELENVNFVDTNEWSNASYGSYEERDMKTTLRVGDASTLNVYVLPSLGWLLGWATFPWEYKMKPEMDGVVIARGTLPEGDLAPFNEGATLTHEVGHWMGLFHTFQGGCYGDGDMIDDTPAQGSASSGCPIGNDTCPRQQGLDPIHNFMDYSDDACMSEFTQGQIVRMNSSFETYRKSLISVISKL